MSCHQLTKVIIVDQAIRQQNLFNCPLVASEKAVKVWLATDWGYVMSVTIPLGGKKCPRTRLLRLTYSEPPRNSMARLYTDRSFAFSLSHRQII